MLLRASLLHVKTRRCREWRGERGEARKFLLCQKLLDTRRGRPVISRRALDAVDQRGGCQEILVKLQVVVVLEQKHA